MTVKESELRERLGIGKTEIKALRETAPEGAWIREESNKPERLRGYLWSDIGVNWLESQLNIKSDSIVKEKIFTEATVLRSGFGNRRIVELSINGMPVRAICRDNTKIKPKAIVKIKFCNGQAFVTEITKKHLRYPV
jgi:hypothetical protein